MKSPLRIDTMFVFVAKDEQGNEGVCGVQVPSSHDPNIKEWLPLVGADMARLQDLSPIAQMIANDTGKTVRLIIFNNRQDMMAFVPKNQPASFETTEKGRFDPHQENN